MEAHSDDMGVAYALQGGRVWVLLHEALAPASVIRVQRPEKAASPAARRGPGPPSRPPRGASALPLL